MKEEDKSLLLKMIERVEAELEKDYYSDFVQETPDELMNLLQHHKTSKLDEFGRDSGLFTSLILILDAFNFPYQICGGPKWVYFEYHPELSMKLSISKVQEQDSGEGN